MCVVIGVHVNNGLLTASRQFLLKTRSCAHQNFAIPTRPYLFAFLASSSIGRFFRPHCGGGARWRPFRFRSPSWMTSFPVPANEVIQDGDRKRKGRHLAPPPQWGSKNPPQVLDDVISGVAILDPRWRRRKWRLEDVETLMKTSSRRLPHPWVL